MKSDKKLGMVLIIGDDVRAVTTWSVRISKYSNLMQIQPENQEKLEKQNRHDEYYC